jgi:outer membrane lipoprotein-sorting protein
MALAAVCATEAPPSLNDIVQRSFEDASFRARLVRSDQRALQRINRDFALPYQFQFTDVRIKEPFMLRVEARVEDTSLVFVLNGANRLYRIPGLGSRREDVSDSPGKRQTVMDFGVLSPALFEDLFKATFVSTDRASGTHVFDITYQRDDTSRHRVWIDKEKRVLTKREWFNQDNELMASIVYEEPKMDAGIWFPTKVSVLNADGRVAAVTEYQNLKLNRGIMDDVFRTE